MEFKQTLLKKHAKSSIKDIIEKCSKMSRELFVLRIKNAQRSLKETHKIKLLRKDIARMKTLLSYKMIQYHGDTVKKKH
jgi:large subunit ribosomal protein L29